MLPKIKKDKNRAKQIKDAVFLILMAVVFFGLVGYSILSNVGIGAKRDQYIKQIDELKAKIEAAQKQKAEIESNLAKAGTKEYLEEVARKQFGLKAPGEEVAVVMKDQPQPSETPNPEQQTSKKKNIWNPLNWWSMIRGK